MDSEPAGAETNSGERGGGLWRTGLKALVAALVATLLVRWVGVSVLDIPLEFPPLAQAGPTVFFTTVSALGAIAVFAIVRRRARAPARLFRGIAAAVLILSFIPDLWLLSEGAGAIFPGGTVPGVGLLMLMHVVAASVIVWVLTKGGVSPSDEQGSLTLG